jgi:adenylosuccinate synthase
MDLIVVGCQAGDEGKGKFTDVACARADAVVRYSAGPNTGHTVVADGQKHQFIQLPAGVLRGAIGVLGNGCIIEPVALLTELAELRSAGFDPQLRISELAHVVFPYHVEQDKAMESWRGTAIATSGSSGFLTGTGQLGSTNRGVGPCREDKIARIGLRMADLLDEALLHERLSRLVPMKRKLLTEVFGRPGSQVPVITEVAELTERYGAAGRELEPSLCDVSGWLRRARAAGQRIVYEGAQSFALDIEQGTYPYVTTGHCTAAGVTIGTGTPPSHDFQVLGVAKCYMVQVGGGPLVGELTGEAADYLVTRGREWGTVTGRRRRVGWFDVPMVRRAVQTDGISQLCLTNLDVLAGLDEVMVVTGYQVEGKPVENYPARLKDAGRLVPVMKRLDGWPDQDWPAAARRGTEALPDQARRFIGFLEESLGVEIVAVGVGPDREDTILLSADSLLARACGDLEHGAVAGR